MSSSCSSLGMVKANNGGVEEREPRMVLLGVDDAISGPSVPTRRLPGYLALPGTNPPIGSPWPSEETANATWQIIIDVMSHLKRPSLRRKTMVPREVIDPPSALCYKS